jgi:uncharacterized hydrophobic protein (TIGR00271 family)
LGLNVNSPAVIIGAMLISPLMGPIMGLGFGMAINDLSLLRKALFNYVFAAVTGLVASTFYFLISPLNEAHSEILARTSPNVYDVLIALFGGLAGMLAVSSRHKGNVIPGVAIATALMPPLCTAGYGLATWHLSYFFGAFYLFLINSVFIALASLMIGRILKFPLKHLPEVRDEKRASRIVWGIVLITVLPSVYFGYEIVQQNKFQKQAESFIESEAVFPNDYLLKKTIDFKKKQIVLIYGGQYIEKKQIDMLKAKLAKYLPDNVTLQIRQGFAYLSENKNAEQDNRFSSLIEDKNKQLAKMQFLLDSISAEKRPVTQLFNEVKAQYPYVESFGIAKMPIALDGAPKNEWIAMLRTKKKMRKEDQSRLESWLKVRVNVGEIKIYVEE